ncbi:retrotransposon protein, putative, ty1-copia subclass [Tanacetum coccineum]
MKLFECYFDQLDFICWKNLRSLSIAYGCLDEDLFQNILSGSPLLETLVLEACYGFELLDITNESVKNLVIFGFSKDIDSLLINAPYILSLIIKDDFSLMDILLLNMSSVIKVELDYSNKKIFHPTKMHEYHEMNEELIKGLILSLTRVKELKADKKYASKIRASILTHNLYRKVVPEEKMNKVQRAQVITELGKYVRYGCTTALNVVPWETDGKSVLRESCPTRASFHDLLLHGLKHSNFLFCDLLVVIPTGASATNTVANHVERPEKFNGQNFKRWQQKMFFYLTTLGYTQVLEETVSEDNKLLQKILCTCFCKANMSLRCWDISRVLYTMGPTGHHAANSQDTKRMNPLQANMVARDNVDMDCDGVKVDNGQTEAIHGSVFHAPYYLSKTVIANGQNRTLNEMITHKDKEETPYELWMGRKPSYQYLRVWGCLAKVAVPAPKVQKIRPKSVDCIFIGYAKNSSAYRFIIHESKNPDIQKNTVMESRNASFFEHIFPCLSKETGSSSRLDDEVVQDKRQQVDNGLQDERQDQTKEEVEPR